MDEITYKGWRIDLPRHAKGWKALIYQPSSLLHEIAVPEGPDRRAVIEEAKLHIDAILAQ